MMPGIICDQGPLKHPRGADNDWMESPQTLTAPSRSSLTPVAELPPRAHLSPLLAARATHDPGQLLSLCEAQIRDESRILYPLEERARQDQALNFRSRYRLVCVLVFLRREGLLPPRSANSSFMWPENRRARSDHGSLPCPQGGRRYPILQPTATGAHPACRVAPLERDPLRRRPCVVPASA